VLPSQPAPPVELALTHLPTGTYRVTVRRTGFHSNDAHTRYLEMGSPKTLTTKQLAELQASTRDRPETTRIVKIGRDGRHRMSVSMRTNDVVLASIEPIKSPSRR
jgi:xylan 1,4-beta-xylosidase